MEGISTELLVTSLLLNAFLFISVLNLYGLLRRYIISPYRMIFLEATEAFLDFKHDTVTHLEDVPEAMQENPDSLLSYLRDSREFEEFLRHTYSKMYDRGGKMSGTIEAALGIKKHAFSFFMSSDKPTEDHIRKYMDRIMGEELASTMLVLWLHTPTGKLYVVDQLQRGAKLLCSPSHDFGALFKLDFMDEEFTVERWRRHAGDYQPEDTYREGAQVSRAAMSKVKRGLDFSD